MGPATLPAAIMSLAMSVVLTFSSLSGGSSEIRTREQAGAAASVMSTPVHIEFGTGTRWLLMHARLLSRSGGRALDWSVDVSVAGVRGAITGDVRGVHARLDLRGAIPVPTRTME